MSHPPVPLYKVSVLVCSLTRPVPEELAEHAAWADDGQQQEDQGQDYFPEPDGEGQYDEDQQEGDVAEEHVHVRGAFVQAPAGSSLSGESGAHAASRGACNVS